MTFKIPEDGIDTSGKNIEVVTIDDDDGEKRKWTIKKNDKMLKEREIGGEKAPMFIHRVRSLMKKRKEKKQNQDKDEEVEKKYSGQSFDRNADEFGSRADK